MLIADGELEIRVVGKNDEELDCEFLVGGAMRSRKSVNVPASRWPFRRLRRRTAASSSGP